VTPSDAAAARDDVRRLRRSLVGAVALAAVASTWILSRPSPLTLNGDAEMLQHPLLVDAVRQAREGKVPVWTAGRWGGSPLIGDPVLGALYPPYYVSYLLTPFPHRRALDVSTCLHLTLLATGMASLMTRLGVGPVAAVAAVAMTIISPTYVYAARGWQQYWAALAYWPWLFWAAASLAHRLSVRPALVATVALAAQVYAGYPEFSLYSGLPALSWIVLARGGLRRVPLVITIGLGAIALALPQVLTGLDMAAESIRLTVETAANNVILDYHFSMTAPAWRDAARATPLSIMTPAKVAPAVVLLAVVGLLGGGFAPRFLAGVAVTTAVLATRDNVLYQAVRVFPPFSFFIAPVKLFYPLCFALLALAGLGLGRLGGLPVPGQRIVVTALGVAAALSWGVTPWAALLGGAGLLLACAPAALLPAGAAALAAAGSVGFLLSTRVLTLPLPFMPAHYIELLRAEPAVHPREGGRLLAFRANPPPAQVGLNLGALWDIEAWNGMADLAQRRQNEVIERQTPGDAVALARQVGADPVVVAEAGSLARAFLAAGYTRAAARDGLVFLTSPVAPPPRAQLVPRAKAATAETAAAAARFGRALDETRVLVEAGALPGGAHGDSNGRLEIREHEPGVLRARVVVARATWLVLRDPYYRNWRATVDDRDAPVYPAGGFFLGVLIAPGAHDVEVVYHERWLLPGVVLAALALALLPSALRRAGAAGHPA
jgi:hypothetical protein